MSRLINADDLKQHYAWWENNDYMKEQKVVFDQIVDLQPTVPQWIDASKDVPDTDRYVLCCTRTAQGRQNVVRGYYAGGRWCCGMNSNVTHWMELPSVEGLE